MKILYKTKKWDKDIAQTKEMTEKFIERHGISPEQFNINNNISKHMKCKAEKNGNAVCDYISLYFIIGGEYEIASGTSWLLYNNIDDCVGNLYLYILSMKKAYDLTKSGNTTQNIAVEKAISSGDEIYLIAHSAMAIDKFNLWSDYSCKIQILTAFYQDNLELARKLVEQLPDNVDDYREVYFYDDKFLKKIYLAILDKDEVRFNDELLNRIKKLRRNMVGYLTYVDVVSISLIKLAKKQGLNYNFDIIEIPKYFFSDDFKIDTDRYMLPEIE